MTTGESQGTIYTEKKKSERPYLPVNILPGAPNASVYEEVGVVWPAPTLGPTELLAGSAPRRLRRASDQRNVAEARAVRGA
jgi:hypothetical protein